MKRKKAYLMLLLLLLWGIGSPFAVQAEAFLFVTASTSDRVHLRAAPDAKAASLGLYFTGTPAADLGYTGNGWVQVMIGSEKGYIRQDLLMDTAPETAWKMGRTQANGSVNLRSAPSKKAPVLAAVPSGTKIAVLGETADHWYYVKAGNTFGYIMTQYVKINTALWQEEGSPALPQALTGAYWFSSGAGGWMSEIIIMEDGRFFGYYHDSDMGDDGPGYPLGTVYESSFTGTFSNLRRINAYEYEMQVTNLQHFGILGTTIREQIKTVTTKPYGVVENSILRVYLPGTPSDRLPEMGRSHFDMERQKIQTAGFYCPDHEALWVQYK